MKANKEHEIWIEIPVKVRVTYYSPADPGRLSGPPEDCYPPEAAEIGFEIIGAETFVGELEQSEKLCDMVLEAHENWLEDRA